MGNRQINNWSRLDNAAKIFPSASDRSDTQVFRFACELNEPVDAEKLAAALADTMEQFPVYRSVLKHGFFWYYLEESVIEPVVRKEAKPPCSTIYDTTTRRLLFEVTYFRNRINLEVYHVLSDGTGAMQFLRTLVYYYLLRAHKNELEEVPELDIDASDEQRMDDSFSRYYTTENKRMFQKHRAAYQIKGQKTQERRLKVIEGVMPVRDVLTKAHEYHTTLTGFLASVFFKAIGDGMPERKKKRPVVIEIPVNLRNYFSSESIRNFFSIVSISYDLREGGELSEIVPAVDKKLKAELMPDAVAARLNALTAMEHNIFARIVPLAVKDLFLKLAYHMSRIEHTAVLSNIGKVTMPEPLQQYIRLFDVFVSTSKVQICMCSFGENLTVSFTSQNVGSDVERRFFRTLTGMGIPVEIFSNRLNEER